jgi:YidC/Oxa1 family membrane protein insertase
MTPRRMATTDPLSPEATMNPWLSFVEIVRFALFAAAHAFGGSIGAGILAFSLALRVVMLPITIPAARKMREQQARLRRLKPELSKLSKRYQKDPLRLRSETMALYHQHGLSEAPPGLGASLVQWPFGVAVFTSLRAGVARNTRFLWIRDLTRPDFALALIAAAIAAATARLNAGDNHRIAMAISAGITLFFALKMSASIALYSIAWNGVSAAESLVLSVTERRRTP